MVFVVVFEMNSEDIRARPPQSCVVFVRSVSQGREGSWVLDGLSFEVGGWVFCGLVCFSVFFKKSNNRGGTASEVKGLTLKILIS